MRIGIVSNSDQLIPLAYTLAGNNLQVYIFYSSSPDVSINQKVEDFIQATRLPMIREQNANDDLYQWIKETAPDMLFVIGYKYLIDINRLHDIKYIYNIHFGPLPSFKGPAPVFWQLKEGLPEIGLCIHELTPRWDDGPIVWQKNICNQPFYDCQQVNQIFSQLCVEGAIYLLKFALNRSKPLVLMPSGNKKRCQKRPGLHDILINWERMSAKQIANLIRACNPWNKGAITLFDNKEVKLMDARIIDNISSEINVPGSIVANDRSLHIYCADGNIIEVNMMYYNDSFVPGYYATQYGFIKGKAFHGMATVADY